MDAGGAGWRGERGGGGEGSVGLPAIYVLRVGSRVLFVELTNNIVSKWSTEPSKG